MHSALQILTAYLTERGVVLAQEAIHKKTNEIPLFQNMLKYLDIQEKTIAYDAMHCQRETCEEIIKKDGNYVFGLKKNQKSFDEDVELFINDKHQINEMEIFTDINKGHGRIEKRICYKRLNIDRLSMKKEWPGPSTIFDVKRIITMRYKTLESINYYISSLNISAKELLFITREHWKIESMHWLLHVIVSEDESKMLKNRFKKITISPLTHQEKGERPWSFFPSNPAS